MTWLVTGGAGYIGAHVHLYGKTPAPGRQLGHVTVLGDELEAARRSARQAASLLEGDG